MKIVHLLDWGTSPLREQSDEREALWRVPDSRDLGELALELSKLDDSTRPVGLVPPFRPSSTAFTCSAMEMCRRHLKMAIFAPVPLAQPREFIHAVQAAGFHSFVLPMIKEWPQLYQSTWDLLDGWRVHVAGGPPDPAMAGWTWGPETL